jgi:hypothetical protein
MRVWHGLVTPGVFRSITDAITPPGHAESVTMAKISNHVLGLAAAMALAACDSPQTTSAPLPGAQAPPSANIPAPQGDLRERQVAFLNRLRAADPQQRTIDRALLNEENELGLILDRSVEMDKIPALMRSILTQMAREFPGEDLTVVAYTPSNPPRTIGTARLNARTRDMTYTPRS